MKLISLIVISTLIPVMGSCTSETCPAGFKPINNAACLKTVTVKEFNEDWSLPICSIIGTPDKCVDITYNRFDQSYVASCYISCNGMK